ncbi:MAG: phosphoglucosamine mutase [Candidatus Hadarchaeales archaeon]
MGKLFGTFGVRGIVNRELTPELAYKLGLALATHLGGTGTVAIGRDNRTSGEMFEQAVAAGLMAGGCDVLRLGLTPTPVLSFAVRYFSCDAGVIITASHNPAEYNGIKFLGSDGAGFERERETEIEKIVEENGKTVSWEKCGKSSTADAIEPYVRNLLTKIPKFERKLKVVVDCGNAVGALVTPYILRELGCEVISMNSQLDGTFPARKLEPVPENLRELSKAVVACEADVGIAHDGDADRTAIVDENGEILMGDRTFAIAALHYLRGRRNPKIITTVATSSVIDDVAERLGGSVVRTKVGEPEIVGEYKRNGGDIGGEENGGVLFFDWTPCRDGIMTAVQFLAELAESGLKVSELNNTLPKYYQVKMRIECPHELKQRVMEVLRNKFSGERICTIDGVRVDFEDGWFIVRPSGTEPIFRCFAEAKTPERAKELAEIGMRELKSCLSGL